MSSTPLGEGGDVEPEKEVVKQMLKPPEQPKAVGGRLVKEFEPKGWGFNRLHWRNQFIRNDYDREEWLYGKYIVKGIKLNEVTKLQEYYNNPQCLGDPIPAPHSAEVHTDEIRRKIICALPRKPSGFNTKRCVCYYSCLSCCGLGQRWYTAAMKQAWWVLGIVYANIWIRFFMEHLEKLFITKVDDPPDVILQGFKNTCLATGIWTVLAFVLYELPRWYHHLPKCYGCKGTAKNPRPHVCCTKCPIRCLRDTKENRRKRSRLEQCNRFDLTFDEEAPSGSWEFNSDDEDPDEFLYRMHFYDNMQQEREEEDLEMQQLQQTVALGEEEVANVVMTTMKMPSTKKKRAAGKRQ
jgi:hypothetical protein